MHDLQSGEVAALPTARLRRQPEFLKLVAACIQQSGPTGPDVISDTTKSDGERVNDLVDVWQQNVSMAWCLVAESHALTILAVEAFAQPRQQGASVLLLPAALDMLKHDIKVVIVFVQRCA